MANNTKKIHKKKKTSKSSSKKTKCLIDKIKSNEKKYTIILVIIFFLIFCFIGYQSLQINNNYSVITENNNQTKLTGKTITLTEKDIKSDINGLESESYIFNIENNENIKIHYRIILEEDKDLIKECGCKERQAPFSSIHYSLDGKNVQLFSSDKAIILEDSLTNNSNKNIKLKIWLSENLDSKTQYHFHGQLKLEII